MQDLKERNTVIDYENISAISTKAAANRKDQYECKPAFYALNFDSEIDFTTLAKLTNEDEQIAPDVAYDFFRYKFQNSKLEYTGEQLLNIKDPRGISLLHLYIIDSIPAGDIQLVGLDITQFAYFNNNKYPNFNLSRRRFPLEICNKKLNLLQLAIILEEKNYLKILLKNAKAANIFAALNSKTEDDKTILELALETGEAEIIELIENIYSKYGCLLLVQMQQLYKLLSRRNFDNIIFDWQFWTSKILEAINNGAIVNRFNRLDDQLVIVDKVIAENGDTPFSILTEMLDGVYKEQFLNSVTQARILSFASEFTDAVQANINSPKLQENLRNIQL